MRITQQALLLALSACVLGCTPVAPWQRGKLAKPQMALEPYLLQNTLQAHIYNSREAAMGGNSAGGGGCGCN
ncbi:MAG: DUF4266 domain-containing protein [Methylobacter sp.]